MVLSLNMCISISCSFIVYLICNLVVIWLHSAVGGTPVFGRRIDPVLTLLTGDRCVGKLSATGQPTRPTQPFILPGSINE